MGEYKNGKWTPTFGDDQFGVSDRRPYEPTERDAQLEHLRLKNLDLMKDIEAKDSALALLNAEVERLNNLGTKHRTEIERLRRGGSRYRDRMREQTTRATEAESEAEELRATIRSIHEDFRGLIADAERLERLLVRRKALEK
jgi:hypothetical protein